MKDSSPGPERKTHKLIPSPLVRNSPENSSVTKWSTSKSQRIICSVHKHCPSSLTPSESKYCKGKQLTSMSSSLQSTPPSQTTEPPNHLKTSNCNSGTWSWWKQSKTMEIGLSHTVHSNVQCSLSTCTGKVSSSTMGNTSWCISPLQMQLGRDESSTSTKWSGGGLDLSTMFPSKISGSLKCSTFLA